MKITYFGHSCFLVETNGKRLLFDPFITPNERAAHIDVAAIQADYILISHGHEDHIADAVQLLKQTGAKAVASWEVYTWLTKQGVENAHPMNTGGVWNFDFGAVYCTVAHHSSSLPDGSYGGNPMGFVVQNAEGTLYYSGDTALTLDMKLIPERFKLDVALLPIGDNFTMGVADAIRAADFIQCDNIIGVHYDTFGFIVVNHDEAKAAFSAAGKTLRLLNIGETVAA
jgi:L-ascorbate metabolism protein UlaG (beta-lactamase superfamily)